MTIRFVDPPGLFRAPGYAHAGVVEGPSRIVFVSGQVSADETGAIVGRGDPAAQAERAYENLRRALEGAGAKPEHVVKWNAYLVGEHDWRQVLRVARERQFPGVRPASTAVRVAALIDPAWLIEVEAYAVIPA